MQTRRTNAGFAVHISRWCCPRQASHLCAWSSSGVSSPSTPNLHPIRYNTAPDHQGPPCLLHKVGPAEPQLSVSSSTTFFQKCRVPPSVDFS